LDAHLIPLKEDPLLILKAMFNKFFKRAKTTPVASTPTSAPTPPAPIAIESKETRLETFREEWGNQWETSHEVIEGNGGNTDWGAWTEAVEEEDKSFAPTVPMPLIPE
jgi:hypothetical protein